MEAEKGEEGKPCCCLPTSDNSSPAKGDHTTSSLSLLPYAKSSIAIFGYSSTTNSDF